MCEFKVIKQNDKSQVGEDILVLSYNENNALVIKDILGAGAMFESALIVDVNTISQECKIIEHPLIKDFIGLLKCLENQSATKEQVNAIQMSLQDLKEELL
ncbi:MAG: hypothetical protein ACFFAS_12445 [Promethearchaeota archaeon]